MPTKTLMRVLPDKKAFSGGVWYFSGDTFSTATPNEFSGVAQAASLPYPPNPDTHQAHHA